LPDSLFELVNDRNDRTGTRSLPCLLVDCFSEISSGVQFSMNASSSLAEMLLKNPLAWRGRPRIDELLARDVVREDGGFGDDDEIGVDIT